MLTFYIFLMVLGASCAGTSLALGLMWIAGAYVPPPQDGWE